MDYDTLVRKLRACDNVPHARAAVELLIGHGHGYWLRRPDFLEACVAGRSDGEAWIRWTPARDYVATAPHAGTHNLAVLDLAVAIGGNRYKLPTQDDRTARLIMIALATAIGMEVPREAAGQPGEGGRQHD
jgi:hypothetical protein